MRIFLLQQTAKELYTLTRSFSELLTQAHPRRLREWRGERVLLPREGISGAAYEVYFDGSYCPIKGTGVGVTVAQTGGPPFLEVACPSVSFDA